MALVLQFSDTHLRAEAPPGDDRLSPDHALRRAVEAAAGLRPDLVLLTGDLADDGSVAALERVRAAVERFGCPVLAIPGNHDLPEAIREVFGPPEPRPLDGWRIIPFDTCIPGADAGRIDVTAALRTIDGLDHRPTMVVLHHPPRSPSTQEVFALVGGDQLLEELGRRPHVRLVASGHLHEAFELSIRELLVVGAPSTWYALEHRGPSHRRAPGAPIGSRCWTLHPDGRFAQYVISVAAPHAS